MDDVPALVIVLCVLATYASLSVGTYLLTGSWASSCCLMLAWLAIVLGFFWWLERDDDE